MLIILDNCEHLIDACAKLTEKLLNNCSCLKILATSREALRCSDEQTHRVKSLNTPNPKEEILAENLNQFESVRLFTERALAVDSNFEINNENASALAGICYQLGGIPLAIELAAARINALSAEKIYERVSDRFKLLTEGKRTSLPRHQTLKAMIDWSYNLLTKPEKILFRRITVFNGGWTLEASESVCADNLLKSETIMDALCQLVDKSIVNYEKESERYQVLETIKQYGQEISDEEEIKKIKKNHFRYFFQLAEKIHPDLYGPSQKECLEKLEIENSNFQSALLFSLEDVENEDGIRLIMLLGKYWKIHSDITEGKRWVRELLSRKKSISLAERAGVLKLAGSLEWLSGHLNKSQTCHEESLSIYRKLKDSTGIASSLGNLGLIEFQKGKYKQARDLTEESYRLYNQLGDKYNTAASLFNLGCIFMLPGEYVPAKAALDKSLQIFREHGDLHGIALCLCNLGILFHYLGEYPKAQLLIEESIVIHRKLGNKHDLALSLNSLGFVAFNTGDLKQSINLHIESLKLRLEIGNKLGMVSSIIGISEIFCIEKTKDASIFLGAANKELESTQGTIAFQIKAVYDKTVDVLIQKLGNLKFTNYFEEGNAMKIEQAAEIVLKQEYLQASNFNF